MSDIARHGNNSDDEKNVAKRIEERDAEKKKKKKMILGGIGAFLLLIVIYGLQPLVAGPVYGICKTYLETRLRYPGTIRVVQYDEFGPVLRIFYRYTDEFGGSRSEMIECIVAPDTTQGYALRDIKINRKSIDPEELALFNSTIPGVVLAEPDLRIPPENKGGLEGLKVD
ncbi:MAG: hypothetical protein H6867_01965 [Rhodospirillales bacterium]|nr:hypothetical protein [Rhodospirillales bacterium]MCB9997284.1 hypothetical protein [Rhodospirillales bacterium]